MLYNRNLQTFDFANLAFQLIDRFMELYTMMTLDQCNEVISIEDQNGNTVIDIISASTNKIAVLEFIINNLTIENLEKVCLKQDKQKKTLLHKLASNADNTSFIEKIIDPLSPKIMAKLITLQDQDNKTVFHMPFFLKCIKNFKKYYTDSDVCRAMNAAILIQDQQGYTPYHHLSSIESSSKSLEESLQFGLIAEVLLHFSTDETLNKLLLLNDKQGINILEANAANHVTLNNDNKKIFNRFASLKTETYTDSIFKLLDKLDDKIASGATIPIHEGILHKILAVCAEYAKLRKDCKFLFKSVRFLDFYPALFFLLRTYEIPAIESLLNNIPAEEFYQNIDRMGSIFKSNVKKTLATIFVARTYIPYLNQDPLAAIDTFGLDTSLTEVTVPMLGYILSTNSSKFKNNILRNPNQFANYMTEIAYYHLTNATKCNPQYSEIIRKGIHLISDRDIRAYPDRNNNNVFTNCLNQLKLVSAYLEKFKPYERNLNALLKIEPADILTSERCEFAAIQCTREAEALPDRNLRKIAFDLHALRFQYQAAVAATGEAEIDELMAINVDDDEKKLAVVEIQPKSIIYNLNVSVYQFLNLKTNSISHETIDEDRYEEALMKLYEQLHTELSLHYDRHLTQFSDYITERARAKSFLFVNSENDYTVRKAYYDILKTQNNNVDDVKSKIMTLTSACNNAVIKKGWSKRSLAFMSQMEEYLSYYVYLNTVKASLPHYVSVSDPFRASM